MKRSLTGLCAAAIALTVSACAADTMNYPSLARRPGERAVDRAAPPAPLPATAATDSALAARLAALVDQAREAHARFGLRRDRAERAISAGGGSAPGSDPWATASIALADLESARSDAMIALADLDQLYAAARTGGDAPASGGAWATIAAARDKVTVWIGEEDQILAALRGQISG